MSSQGIIGLGVSHDTIFDKAYEAKQIKSPNYILRLQSRDQPSGLYFNELPEDIVKRSKFAALSDTNIWVTSFLYLGSRLPRFPSWFERFLKICIQQSPY